MQNCQLLIVDSAKHNGLLIYKPFHVEFAGPGAAIGGQFDRDCQKVLAIGDFSTIEPESHTHRQKSYEIRRLWVRLIEKLTTNPDPTQRALMIINQFSYYFAETIIDHIPDEAFALLVGVLPQTIHQVRVSK